MLALNLPPINPMRVLKSMGRCNFDRGLMDLERNPFVGLLYSGPIMLSRTSCTLHFLSLDILRHLLVRLMVPKELCPIRTSLDFS